jgi:hypothetical protein
VTATFIIDWPVLMFIGILFGAFAPRQRWWKSRAFLAGTATALAFTAVAFISYLVAPDWMWMYLFEPSEAAWSLPGIAIGYLFTFALAFAGAVALAEIGRHAVVAAAVTALVGEIGIVAITWDRYHLVGTRNEWLSGSASELFSTSPAGDAKTIGLLGPLFLIVAVVSLVLTIRGRRATAADR